MVFGDSHDGCEGPQPSKPLVDQMGGSAYGRETVGWSLAILTTAARDRSHPSRWWTNAAYGRMGGSAYGRETVGWSLAIPTTAARDRSHPSRCGPILIQPLIGVGTKEALPLPPNRAGRFLAPGSPVGGCFQKDRQSSR
jgi:hypothetical protein